MNDVYSTVTNKLIEAMQAGFIPWRKPWRATGHGARVPSNLLTGRMYRGINVWLLHCAPYQSNEWLTFNQARDKGAHVRKGEKGWPVVFWKFDQEDKESGRRRSVLMRSYTVFNTEQIDGLPGELPFDAPPFDSIAAAETVRAGYFDRPGAPQLFHAGGQAYYSPAKDEVVMPAPHTFIGREEYYSTLFHEAGHSTGHSGRLARDLDGNMGSQSYSKEELIAEFTAAFLCAECGISNESTEQNSAAYLQNWLQVFKGDKHIAVSAAQRAQRAADLILGRAAVESTPQESETAVEAA